MNDALIIPSELEPLGGSEPLGSATVLDFWKWAFGDLRMNNARGYLVEFLVAQALGDPSRVRVEWGPYDVQAGDGTLVEVKATGRLQSWVTKKLSPPSWTFRSVRASAIWSEELGRNIDIDPANRVHVWVFALHTATEPTAYDPTDISQWEFRVLPHRQLLASGRSGEALVLRPARRRPVSYVELPEAVAAARAQNDQPSSTSPH